MQRNVTRVPIKKRAFTLTELLVVMAITAILLGLLFIPIVQGFNLTRTAQNRVQAQGQARRGLQLVSRELAQAVYVFDNGATPVVLPLKFPINVNNGGAPTTSVTWANGQVVYPVHSTYSKVDFVPAGRIGGVAGVTDPTTRDVLGGSDVRFPLAPGIRVVRYFIGLRDNSKPYENVFLRTINQFSQDGNVNPFVLYRAEYDPEDPNLFDFSSNRVNYNSAVDGLAGFNDPNFFYNLQPASSTNVRNGKVGNGRTYAQNWKDISTAIVDGPNQDVVNWVKDEAGDLVITSPLRPLISFQPSTIPSDTATPGFMTAAASEVPNAVPTMYSTQQAHWTMPYTATIYRAPSRPSSQDYGAIRISIDGELQPDGTLRPHVHVDPTVTGGVLNTSDNDLYCATIETTGEIFVKTPNLTFMIDPERGRIKTGFPPLAGDVAGAPLIRLADNSIRTMVAGPWPDANRGELVQTVYRLNTRRPEADTDSSVPSNQGWSEIDLWDSASRRYYLDGVAMAIPVSTTTIGSYASPLSIFGNVQLGVLQAAGGLMVAAGTERIIGPDLSVTAGGNDLGLVTYFRSPGAITSVIKKATLLTDPNNITRKIWSPMTGQRNYVFDQDTHLNGATGLPGAFVRFDNIGGPGLPARPFTDAGNIAEREVQVTYLWQNNYARRSKVGTSTENGQPTDASGKILGETAMIAPDPDVVKMDYGTRDVITVNLGVNVYDSNTHQATSISLNDKVRVSNTTR